MAKTLVDFITALAKKSGMKMDDEKLTTFLALEGLKGIEIPDEVASMDNKLITIADAINNHPEIFPHYKAKALNPLDKIVERLVEESGFDKDISAQIIASGTTYQKVEALVKAVKEFEGKKGITDKDAKAAFQKQVDETMTKLRAIEAERETDKKKYETDLKSFKLEHEKKGLFSEFKTVYDDLPGDVRTATFLNLLNKELQDKSAEIDYDDTGSLVLRKKDGTNYYGENNTQLTHKQFVEQILSKNKVLKVNGTAGSQGQNSNNGSQGQNNGRNSVNTNGNDGKNSGSQTIKSLNEQAIKDAENAHSFG